MVNVNVIGRLGADSELKSSLSGKQFVTFRLATDQYNRKTKTNETIWFNVIDFSERAIKMQSNLKKGSMVNVFGVERLELFQNKNGETVITRELLSDRFEFVSSGVKQQNGQDSSYANSIKQSVADAEAFRTPQPSYSSQVTIPTVDVSSLQPVSDDDLPF